jgi:hypothetical protein
MLRILRSAFHTKADALQYKARSTAQQGITVPNFGMMHSSSSRCITVPTCNLHSPISPTTNCAQPVHKARLQAHLGPASIAVANMWKHCSICDPPHTTQETVALLGPICAAKQTQLGASKPWTMQNRTQPLGLLSCTAQHAVSAIP